MRLLKSQSILRIANSYVIDTPEPANISYLWNFGSLLGVCLIIQILTGVFLAMHYTPHVDFAFNSVEHLHIARGLYYSSYKEPRVLLWSIGVIIFIVMIATAFLGYVWGGFSVNNATLNRFFSLHFLLPFLLAALVVAHLIALHTHGSNNPNGISGNGDRIPFHPYFVFKDLVTIFAFLLVLSIMVFYYPNVLGQLLPFYAILRSIPNKLLGVIAMFGSLLILLILPLTDLSVIRGSQFRPLMRLAHWFFVVNFFILMWIGACHPTTPYLEIGQVATVIYFSWFLIIVPIIGIIENTAFDVANEQNKNLSK
uniref:Cytochrome b n=1 Tax=Phellinotus piptadeniae TaxID=1638731 RepID=A0A8A5M794_9AGAM|nr:cytochrome b [Phellinotus piptadeniae]QTF87868.1 cytochrome b [Phellinotus piptadeniae]